MSEHTSSCLICDEKEECKRFMPTIRKAGVTTGCRYCPNDGQCEFQDCRGETRRNRDQVSDLLSRHESGDGGSLLRSRLQPLCPLRKMRPHVSGNSHGECPRLQEQRTPDHRRPRLWSHSFGGRLRVLWRLCIRLPDRDLREKTRAWEGKTDREVITTCSFCGVGCQVRLQVKGNRIIGSLPASDPLVNEGQLCVKGRFCGTELVNGPLRLKNPYRMLGETKAEISWEVATDMAAEQLKNCPPEDFGMLVSPNCSNEDLYVAQKFARVAMRSHNIDTVGHGYSTVTGSMHTPIL